MAAQDIYSVANLITRIRVLYDETDSSNSYVSNAELIYFLNLGQLDLSNRVGLTVESTTSISGSSFTNGEYTMTESVRSIDLVTVNDLPINPMRFKDKDYSENLMLRGRTDQDPEGWYFRANKLGIPQISTADTVKVYWRGQAEELVDAGTVSLPAYCNNALINYALKLCKQKEQDEQGASFYDGLYEREVTKISDIYWANQVQVKQIQTVC